MLTVNDCVHSAVHAAGPVTPAFIVSHITGVLIQSGQECMIMHVYSTIMFTT